MEIVIEVAGYTLLVLCIIIILGYVSFRIGLFDFLFKKTLVRYEKKTKKS
jgi:hypothetical protein